MDIGAIQVLQQCTVLGAIEGSDLIEERVRSARETSKREVDGEWYCITSYFCDYRFHALVKINSGKIS